MKRKKIPSFIINFCKEISEQKPIVVPVVPLPNKPINTCFHIMPEHIASCGGKQKIGWCIRVWRRVWVEAEFHCIWESPENNLIDITPKKETVKSIVFLPDPEKKYIGRQVDNIRKPLTRDKHVLEFMRLAEENFRHFNAGDLANYHGDKFPFTQRHIEVQNEMKVLRDKIIIKYGYLVGPATGC